MCQKVIISTQILFRYQKEKMGILWLKAIKNIFRASHLYSLKARLLHQVATLVDKFVLPSGAMSP